MTSDAPIPLPVRPRASGAFRIALYASLALNVLFVGGLLGAIFRHGGQFHGPSAVQNNLASFVATLPADRARVIRRQAGDKRRDLPQMRRELRQARDDAVRALAEEPFDSERFVKAQTRLIELEHTQRLAQRDVLTEAFSSMTPDERRAFVRWRAPRLPPVPPGEPNESAPPKRP